MVTMVVGEHYLYFLGRDLTGPDDVLVIAVRVIFDMSINRVATPVIRPDMKAGVGLAEGGSPHPFATPPDFETA
jgi:hypothetical protein